VLQGNAEGKESRTNPAMKSRSVTPQR